MKKLLLLCFLSFGCANNDAPEARTITDHFVDYWWEFDFLGYNKCFKLQEEGDVKNPAFIRAPDETEQELFGTWTFEPPNTFYVYEDGEESPYEVHVYEDKQDCWMLQWGSVEVEACPCSFE
jgi:hypothetical protein